MDKNDNNEAAIKSEIERLQRELKEKERKFELRKLRKKAKLEKLSNNSVIKAPIEAPPIKINNNEPGALNDCYNPIKKSKVTFQEEVTVFQDPGSQNDNKEVGHHQKGSEEVFQTLDSVETVPANQSNVRKSKRSRKAVDYVELSKGSGPKRSKIDHKEIAILAFEAVIQIAKETPDEEFHLPLDIFPNYSYSLSSVISRIANDDRNAELLLYNQSSSSSDNTLESWKDTDERESKSSVSPCHDETEVERCNAEETENVNVICTTQKLVSSEVMEAEMKENLKISSVDTFQIDLRQMVEEPVEEVDDIFSIELDEGHSNIETSKLITETTKPIVETTKPIPETTKPVRETSQPIVETSKPIVETSKPITEPSKSITEPSKPITETSKPIMETSKPITETSKPITETPKPITETPKPITETTKPIPETTKPIPETTKPITETPKPITETPKPITETSKPITETSKPIAETSKPITETTKPITETTKPVERIEDVQTELLLEEPCNEVVTKTDIVNLDESVIVNETEDIFAEMVNKTQEHVQLLETEPEVTQESQTQPLTTQNSSCSEISQVTVKEYVGEETVPEIDAKDIFVYDLDEQDEQEVSSNIIPKIGVKSEHILSQSKDPTTNEHILSQSKEDSTSEHFLPQTKDPSTSEHILSQSKEYSTSEHILSQTKDPTTSEHILSQTKDPTTSEHILSQSKVDSTSEHFLPQTKDHTTSEHILSQPEQNSSQPEEHSTSVQNTSQTKEHSTLSIKFEEENIIGAETDENHKETIQVPNVNENQNDIEKYVHKFNDNNETKTSVKDHEMVLKDIKNTREIHNSILAKDFKKEDNEIDDKEMIEKKVKTSTADSNVVFCVKRHSFNCYKCPKDEPILKILCLDREKSLFAVQQLTTIQIMKLNDTRQWEMIYYNYLNQEIIFSFKLADYLVILMKENLFGVNYNNLEEFYHGFNFKNSGDFKACSLQNNFFATCSIIDDQSQVTVHKIKHNKLLSSKVMEQTAETLTNICSVSNIDKVVAGVTTNGIILWNYHLGIIKLRVTLDPVIDAPFSLSWITREENKNLLYSLIKLDNHPNSCLLVINPLTGKHQILREYKSALNILDNKSRSYFVDNPCVTEVISEERLVVYNLFTGTEKASLEIDSVTSGVTVCLGDKNFILTGFKNGCLHSFFM